LTKELAPILKNKHSLQNIKIKTVSLQKNLTMKAIEITGEIEKAGLLKLDFPIDLRRKQKVKVIILYNEEDNINERLWLTAISNNPVFEFLKDKAEDIYSILDGKPIKK